MIVRSIAPLRLGLAGGGTDVSPYPEKFGGYVLNATIDLKAYCTLELLDNGKITFVAADRNEYFECELQDTIELDGYLDLHKAIYNRMVKQFNDDIPLSVKLTTYSDAPAGSGLGSSSTIVVAMIKAFAEALSLPLGEYDIADLAFQIERQDVGLSGGKQDQYAATFGGFNFIEFNKDNRVIVNPLRVDRWIINELESSMILYYTGTSRESAKIINEQTKNVQENNFTSLTAMHDLKKDTLIMKEAVLKGNIQTFAEYLGKSWETKKKLASTISNPKIEQIYSIALNGGAYAGKVSGAGGGGFMMFVVDPVQKKQLINKLQEHGGVVMNFHFINHGVQGWRVK